MKRAPIPENDAVRLADLNAYQLLDTLPESVFDDLTALAAEICGVPIALVSLVDANRQWFKSRHGLDAEETPRDVSFCGHAVADDAMLVVPDALADDRFADNPLVVDEPNVRFYAGALLKSARGHNLGTLCVIDNQPRELSPKQVEHLQRIARQVEAQFELRKHALDAACLRELHAVSSCQDLAHADRVAAVLELGLQVFQTDSAVIGEVRDQTCWVTFSAGEAPPAPGSTRPVTEVFCELTMARQEVVALHDTRTQQVGPGSDSPFCCYLGAPITVDGAPYGTLSFLGRVPRERPFSDHEVSLIGLYAEWVGHELAREQARIHIEGMNEELLASNQELNQFAYVVSHDLKAPLRAMGRLVSWVQEDLDGTISDTARKHLDKMTGRVNRMDGLINGILEYSRVSRRKDEAGVVELGPLVDEVLEALAPPASFRIETGQGLPAVRGDRTQLFQVYSNLIGNAVKYHDRPDGCIRVTHERDGTAWKFCVADDGPGIEPEYREKVFQIFQTLSARDVVESTGIGLSIVKKIIESQGGRIWIESATGRGSAFWFTWPCPEEVESAL